MEPERSSPCSQEFATGRILEPHKPSPLPYTQHLKDPLHHHPPVTTTFPKQPIYVSFSYRTQEYTNQLAHISLYIIEFIGHTTPLHVSAHRAIKRYITASSFQVLRQKFCRPSHFSSAPYVLLVQPISSHWSYPDEYRLWSSSLCNYLPLPVTSAILGSNILLNTFLLEHSKSMTFPCDHRPRFTPT
jgi:hypothetical protein